MTVLVPDLVAVLADRHMELVKALEDAWPYVQLHAEWQLTSASRNGTGAPKRPPSLHHHAAIAVRDITGEAIYAWTVEHPRAFA